MTREEAWKLLDRENREPGSTYRTDRDEALRVLSLPVIELEGWEVEADLTKLLGERDQSRVIVLRRRS